MAHYSVSRLGKLKDHGEIMLQEHWEQCMAAQDDFKGNKNQI